MAVMAKSTLCLSILALLQSCSAYWLPQRLLAPTDSLKPAGTSNLPLIIWHGLGDNYQSDGLLAIESVVNDTIGPTYTYIIHLDEDASADRTATFVGNLTTQVEQVCNDLASHPVLSKAPAVNALGFSQGGQFLRAYVERCNNPKVANLVTFGSQHNGISEFQNCAPNDWLCDFWSGALKANTWDSLVQSKLVPAQYFRDPEDLESYLENSNFLADVNNEREVKNSTYKENMKKLENFVMYLFANDTAVVPKESAWFAEVNTTTDEVTKLQHRTLYKEDWLGLKSLDEDGRLHFKTIVGSHMQFGDDVVQDVAKKYFKSQ